MHKYHIHTNILHTCIHACIHPLIYTFIHTYTHTYIHTYTHISILNTYVMKQIHLDKSYMHVMRVFYLRLFLTLVRLGEGRHM
jgi:hypothetical protein